MTTQEIILIVCAFGFGYSSFKAGLKQGRAGALDFLREKKIITYDNKGNIQPNKFYQEEED
jgi:hypothetical protein